MSGWFEDVSGMTFVGIERLGLEGRGGGGGGCSRRAFENRGWSQLNVIIKDFGEIMI